MYTRNMKLLWWWSWWTWKDTLAAAGGATVLLVLLEKIKNAGLAGYRGAGLLWKWVMRSATYRKEMENRHAVLYKMVNDISQAIGEIRKQVYANGGTSLMDGQNRLQKLVGQQAELIRLIDARQTIAEIANNRMTFRLDKEGACVEINEVFLKKFGYNEDDIKGFGFENVVHEDDVIEMRSKWNRAIEQRSRFYDEQRIKNCLTNEYVLCLVRGYPICENDIIQGFTGIIEVIVNPNKN